MIKENGKPVNMNIDDGKEFVYKPFVNYCKENDIKLWISDPEQTNKNAIIERFHRTLRNLILKYEVANGKSYIDILPSLVENYNSTFHKTLEENPIDIWKGRKTNQQNIIRMDIGFAEGDKVRHIINKKAFEKGSSTTNYTKKIYKITKIIGKSIFLDDLTKPFKSFELVKAVGEEVKSSYDESNEKDKQDETVKRRIRKEGIQDHLKAGKYYK
jgi:transposase InsO family protein